jgi:nitronate monooxygenase
MAGANGSAIAIAVCQAGGLGSLPCAMADSAKVRAEIGIIRQRTARPLNVNFFCHTPAKPDAERDAAWKARLPAQALLSRVKAAGCRVLSSATTVEEG